MKWWNSAHNNHFHDTCVWPKSFHFSPDHPIISSDYWSVTSESGWHWTFILPLRPLFFWLWAHFWRITLLEKSCSFTEYPFGDTAFQAIFVKNVVSGPAGPLFQCLMPRSFTSSGIQPEFIGSPVVTVLQYCIVCFCFIILLQGVVWSMAALAALLWITGSIITVIVDIMTSSI